MPFLKRRKLAARSLLHSRHQHCIYTYIEKSGCLLIRLVFKRMRADKSKWGEIIIFFVVVSVPIKDATIIKPQTKVNYGKLHDPMSGCLTFCTTMRKDSLEYDPASQGSDAIAGNRDNKLYKIPHPFVCTSLYKTACAY